MVTLNREKQEASFTSLPPPPHQIKHLGILRNWVTNMEILKY